MKISSLAWLLLVLFDYGIFIIYHWKSSEGSFRSIFDYIIESMLTAHTTLMGHSALHGEEKQCLLTLT